MIYMKKIFKISALILFLFCSVAAEASTIKQERDFDLKLKSVFSSDSSNYSGFILQIDEKKNIPDNVIWKLRAYCDNYISIRIKEKHKNICNKNVKINPINDLFGFELKDKNEKPNIFSIKLKAYDINGKILHIETERFKIK